MSETLYKKSEQRRKKPDLTVELRFFDGAGDGNRTRVIGLGSRSSATELRLQLAGVTGIEPVHFRVKV